MCSQQCSLPHRDRRNVQYSDFGGQCPSWVHCRESPLTYLFERRQVAGAVPKVFLKAREKAASEP
jgi:hypothetical protein